MFLPTQAHTPHVLQQLVAKAFEAAFPHSPGCVLVVAAVDAAQAVHYQTNTGPTLNSGLLVRAPYEGIAHDQGFTVFDEALAAVEGQGLGLVVLQLDADERLQYQTNMGRTLLFGLLHRCSLLHDVRGATPAMSAVGGGQGGAGPRTN